MRTIKHLLTVFAVMALVTSVAFAGDAEKKSDEQKAEKVELKNQTHCPVMGGVIDSAVFTDIQGQRVYHCCPGCGPELTKNPDKYFKQAAEKGIVFENIQTACPVSGKELENKTVGMYHEGRMVYFCCGNCQPPFEAEPAKFLLVLDEQVGNKQKAKKEDHGHDHEHGDHDHGHDH